MPKFTYKFSIEAPDKDTAQRKMSALATLAKKLSLKELETTADVLANKPVKAKVARKMLSTL